MYTNPTHNSLQNSQHTSHNNQIHNNQSHNNQIHNNQSHNNQIHNNQSHNNQSHNDQSHNDQSHNNQSPHHENELTHPFFAETSQKFSSGGHNTRKKKIEMSAFQRQTEPNHTHPNHRNNGGGDPFHGNSVNHNAHQKQIRNQNMHKYQMDPRRAMGEMNANAQHMFNSHNEQINQNEFSKFATTHNLEPSYYDQSNYSGIDLQADRMFLADAKEVSDQYTNAATMAGQSTQFIQNVASAPVFTPSTQTEHSKERRSYRNPNDEVDSNNKIWEYQFTPMTMPL
jgi:hypothetical protein